MSSRGGKMDQSITPPPPPINPHKIGQDMLDSGSRLKIMPCPIPSWWVGTPTTKEIKKMVYVLMDWKVGRLACQKKF